MASGRRERPKKPKMKNPYPTKRVKGKDGRFVLKTEFDEADIEKIERMAGIGLTLTQIAIILGMSDRSFSRHKKQIPEVEEAFQRGKVLAIEAVASNLFELCMEKHAPSIMFFLKTQGRWKEVNRVETQVNDVTENKAPNVSISMDLSNASDAQIDKIVSRLRGDSNGQGS